MAWRLITKEDVAASVNQDEIDAYCQLPDFKSQADPVADLILEIASYVRGFCRASGVVKIDYEHTHTVPEALIKCAVDIIVYRMLARMPMEVLESRKEAWKSAEELLAKVSRKEFVPESYGVTDEVNWNAVPLCGFSLRPNFTLRGSPSGCVLGIRP